jgi:hypothetical protein
MSGFFSMLVFLYVHVNKNRANEVCTEGGKDE